MQKELYVDVFNAEKSHWWFQGRRAILRHVFWDKYNLNKKSDIFSVGCGSVAELEELSYFGRVLGIDISDFCVNNALNAGFDATKGDITKNSIKDEQYDVVVALDVLEHIKDDKIAIKEIFRILKKGGYALITVPAGNYLWSRYDEQAMHYRRYTKDTLLSSLSNNDIEILEFSYFNFFMLPAIFISRKLLNVAPHKQLIPPNRPLNFFLKNIFAFEKYLLKKRIFPVGCSLLLVCKKS